MEPWYILILYFAVFSFLGPIIWYVFENLSFVPQHKKFLHGPFFIIDGIAVLFIYFYNLLNIPLAIKIISYFFILFILEYFVSVFRKIPKPKSKNYSKHKFNLNVRVNLKIVLLWFALILFVVFIGQEFTFQILHKLPINLVKIFAVVFLIYLAIDIFFSIRKHLKK